MNRELTTLEGRLMRTALDKYGIDREELLETWTTA